MPGLWTCQDYKVSLFLCSDGLQIQSSIGRMILKEEMKARSSSYDNDPWASARNSRSGSKETLQSIGYEPSMNGCKELCHWTELLQSVLDLLGFRPILIVCVIILDTNRLVLINTAGTNVQTNTASKLFGGNNDHVWIPSYNRIYKQLYEKLTMKG